MTSEPKSSIDHRGWTALATEEYRRLEALLAPLPDPSWTAQTECPPWRVREIVAHLIGAADAAASIREQMRQQRLGGKEKGERSQIDAVNDIQVREHAALGPAELRARLHESARRGLKGRSGTPGFVRALRFPFPEPLGRASLGFLIDVVYTRDAWMHRVDICRALDLPFEFTAEHDGRIIGEAARSWQHLTQSGPIVLTDPAGAPLPEFDSGTTTYDAVDFARALSGRGTIDGVRPDLVLF